MADRYPAEVEGIRLQIRDISDSYEKAVAQHEFPHTDGAELEDMGLRARTIRFTCFFFNETYDDHFRLVELLKEKELLTFIHPRYGVLSGKVDALSIRHDNRLETAEVDVTFTQNRTDTGDSLPYEDISGKAESHVESVLAEQEAEFRADAREALGPEAQGILGKALDPGKGIIEQFSELTGSAREYVKTIDTAINGMQAAMNEVAAPANSLVSMINFAEDLPGRVLGAVAGTIDRYATAYESLRAMPSRFFTGFKNGMLELEKSLGLDDTTPAGGSRAAEARAAARASMSRQIRITAASMAALQISYIYAEDEDDRDTLRRTEKATAWDTGGNYIRPEQVPDVLSIIEIEKSLAEVRAYIQEAVDLTRSVPTLKAQALSLARHVALIKLEREKIKTVDIALPMPLHVLCLRHGLPYSYAPRILAINPHIDNPNYVQGEVSVYVR